MPYTPSTADPDRARELRETMTGRLVAAGWITSPEAEAAFRAVPRHEFVPAGTSLEDAYGENVAPITKQTESGAYLSSSITSWIATTPWCLRRTAALASRITRDTRRSRSAASRPRGSRTS